MSTVLVYWCLFVSVDHLVNNAGIGCVCSFEEVTDITKLAPVMVNFSTTFKFSWSNQGYK